MKQLFTQRDLTFLIGFLTVMVISGCAGSKKAIIPLELSGEKREAINFMPFNSEFVREYYSDANRRAADAYIMQAVIEAVDDASGLYTYTFDGTDLQNLRVSITESLIDSHHYENVYDIDTLDKKPSDSGNRLYIEFESMGVTQNFAFICEIKAHAKVCNGNEATITEKDISIREKGVVTLMAAKNKAIKSFVLEIGCLLNEAG